MKKLKADINKLKINWAKENNPVKLGDTLHHYSEAIKVEGMQFLETEGEGLEEGEPPQYLYMGLKLTLKGASFKNEVKMNFMQHEITAINKSLYDFETCETELEDFKSGDLISELEGRGDLSEATEGLTAEELTYGREDEFNGLHVESFGDLDTPHEKETFKRFLCDLMGVSYHTPTRLLLTKLKGQLV